MFNIKKSVTSSDFRQDMAGYLAEIKSKGDALQLIQRGANPVRILITQEYFLDLIAKVQMYEILLNKQRVPEGKMRPTFVASTDSEKLNVKAG